MHITFDEDELKKIADTIIKRRASKIIKNLLKERQFLESIKLKLEYVMREECKEMKKYYHQTNS